MRGFLVSGVHSWECQAKLYDSNGPDLPHEWCVEDLFSLNIQLGISTGDDPDAAGLAPRTERVAYIDSYENTLYFGPAGGALSDVPLESTAHLFREGDHVLYHIFDGSELGTGLFEWVWEADLRFTPPFSIGGEIEIVSHATHEERVADGSWQMNHGF